MLLELDKHRVLLSIKLVQVGYLVAMHCLMMAQESEL